MGMINSEQRLPALAHATRRREDVLGCCEVAGLGRVGLIAQRMNLGNHAVATAQQSAAFRRRSATRVIDHRILNCFRDRYNAFTHALNSPPVGIDRDCITPPYRAGRLRSNVQGVPSLVSITLNLQEDDFIKLFECQRSICNARRWWYNPGRLPMSFNLIPNNMKEDDDEEGIVVHFC